MPSPGHRKVLSSPAYQKFISQLEAGTYNPVRINSINYTCASESLNALPAGNFSNEPVEDFDTSWRYSFEQTENGFLAKVNFRNVIQCEEADDIVFEIGFDVFYKSEIKLRRTWADCFAWETLLPQIWPYFRMYALDNYHKSGLLWVILPFEANNISRDCEDKDEFEVEG